MAVIFLCDTFLFSDSQIDLLKLLYLYRKLKLIYSQLYVVPTVAALMFKWPIPTKPNLTIINVYYYEKSLF